MTAAEASHTEPAAAAVLTVDDLEIEVARSGARIVDGVSLELANGEVLGLAGESGCGKTTLALALLGYTRRGLRLRRGAVRVDGRSLFDMDERSLDRARGSLVAYVPQDPATALNPALRVGTQLDETLTSHGAQEDAESRRARIAAVLEDVKLPPTARLLRSYPHQLSGGQQQRIAIAMAILNRPRLIVMDEPTTGLDVTTQAHVLQTIREICEIHGGGVVYVTHDLAVVSDLAIRVAVMYAGRLAEIGPAGDVLGSPRHPYVRGLLRAVPDIEERRGLVGIPGQAPEPSAGIDECLFASRCSLAMARCREAAPPRAEVGPGHTVWCIRSSDVEPGGGAPTPMTVSEHAGAPALVSVTDLDAWYGSQPVLSAVSLVIREGSSLALVGESGSGKTTLARCIAGLHAQYSGSMSLEGEALEPGARSRPQAVREAIQYVFQNPYASLNPRRTIEQSVAQPLWYAESRMTRRQITAAVDEALAQVALGAAIKARFPHELSGGQRQRVAVARALIVNPKLLVCDEVTSALDVSVQAVVIELLDRLRRERNLSLLFVTHNLALVQSVADDIAVILGGQIIEHGPVHDVLTSPRTDETRTLLANVPRLTPGLAR
jgi:peptide/nickel transport system ATP-binding protein